MVGLLTELISNGFETSSGPKESLCKVSGKKSEIHEKLKPKDCQCYFHTFLLHMWGRKRRGSTVADLEIFRGGFSFTKMPAKLEVKTKKKKKKGLHQLFESSFSSSIKCTL